MAARTFGPVLPTAPQWAQRLGIFTNRGAVEYRAHQLGFKDARQQSKYYNAMVKDNPEAEADWKAAQAKIRAGENHVAEMAQVAIDARNSMGREEYYSNLRAVFGEQTTIYGRPHTRP